MGTLWAEARSMYRPASEGVSHFLTFSLLGGEANTFVTSSNRVAEAPVSFHNGFDVVNLPGGEGQFELNYELKQRAFFFSVGGHIRYDITGQRLGTFRDEYRCLDVDGEAMDYRFNFSNYYEYQQSIWAGGNLRFGAFVHPKVYFALGAKVEYPLWNMYISRTNLSTSGYWPFAFGGVESAPGENNFDYGFFSEDLFLDHGKYMQQKTPIMVTPCAEVGTCFHLMGRASMRVAAYVEYAIPIGAEFNKQIVDYSNVHIVPDYTSLNNNHPQQASMRASMGKFPPSYWQTREQLWSTLHLNSVLDFAGQDRAYNRLSVGVKLAFMINLNGKPRCVTCDDDSGRSYIQPKHIRKRNDLKYRRW